jgi:lycopene beta-cyclase
MQRSYDMLLVGGGLANSLIAATVLESHPETRLLLVEQEVALGGNHTWSFLTTDISAPQQARLERWAAHTWPAYRVRFPAYQRTVLTGYHTLTAAALDAQVRAVFAASPHGELRLGQRVTAVSSHGVTLDGGEELAARCVLDGRGPTLESGGKPVGFQKFLGLEVTLRRPWMEALPTLMDASVEQLDGFRFVYVLPLSPTRLLVEDTYYSRSPELARPALRERVRDYIASKGAEIVEVVREESGVLPLPRSVETPSESTDDAVAVGYRGGWFHPTTGYSLPQACRVADCVAAWLGDGREKLDLTPLFLQFRGAKRFACTLNGLLFNAFESHQQRNVLERFYQLPEPLIARFYALETTLTDRARIVCGRVPKGFSLPRLLQGANPV